MFNKNAFCLRTSRPTVWAAILLTLSTFTSRLTCRTQKVHKRFVLNQLNSSPSLRRFNNPGDNGRVKVVSLVRQGYVVHVTTREAGIRAVHPASR